MTPSVARNVLTFSFQVYDQNSQEYKIKLDPNDPKEAEAFWRKGNERRKVKLLLDSSLQLSPKAIIALFLDNPNPPIVCDSVAGETNPPCITLKIAERQSSVLYPRFNLNHTQSTGIYRLRFSFDTTVKVSAKFFPAVAKADEEAPQVIVDQKPLKGLSSTEVRGRLGKGLIGVQLLRTETDPIAIHYLRLTEESNAGATELKVASVDARRDQNIAAPVQLTSKPSRLNIINNCRELVLMSRRNPQASFSTLARQICRLFDNVHVAVAEELYEIAELIPVLRQDEIKRVLAVASRTIPHEKFLRLALLRAWVHLIEQITYASFNRVEQWDLAEIFKSIPAEVAHQAIKQIKSKLTVSAERAKLTEESITAHLEALWAFLTVVSTTTPSYAWQTEARPIMSWLDSKDVNRAYVAHRAKSKGEWVGTIWVRNTKVHHFIEWNNSGSLLAPLERFSSWILQLEYLKFLVINNETEHLLNEFKKTIDKKIIHAHFKNPFFQKELIKILNEIIATPKESLENLLKAFKIMVVLTEENKEGIWYCEGQHGPAVRKLACQSVRNCLIHPRSELSAEARLASSGSSLFPILFGYPLLPAPMFQKAVSIGSTADLANPLTSQNLDGDTQRKEDEPTYIPLYARTLQANESFPLVDHLEHFFFDNNKKVAKVEGIAGSGKSCASKQIAWRAGHLVVSEIAPPPLTYYVNLPRFKDKSTTEFVTAGLRAALTAKTTLTPRGEPIKRDRSNTDEGLHEKLEKLKSTKFAFFVDGLDEIAKADLEGFFSRNISDMKKYPQAQFVFFSRTGYFEEPFFDSLKQVFGAISTFDLAPFAPEQLQNYVWNFFQQRPFIEEEEDLDWWTYDKCMEVIKILTSLDQSSSQKKGMLEELRNPFLLATCVKILPYVVEKFRNEDLRKGPHQDRPRPLKEILLTLGQRFEDEILKAHVCVSAKREEKRSRSKQSHLQVRAEEILKFQVEVAKYMAAQGHEELKFDRLGKLFDKQKIALGIANKDDDQILSLLQASLVLKDDAWEFRHIKLQEFFVTAAQIPRFVEQLTELIATNAYTINTQIQNVYFGTEAEIPESGSI